MKTPEEKRQYHKDYYYAHRDEQNEKRRLYRIAHREEIRAQQNAKYAANCEERRKKARVYCAANREKIRAQTRARYARHSKEGKAYHQTHRDKLNAQERANYVLHREEKRAYRFAHREEAHIRSKTYRTIHKEELKAKGVAKRQQLKREIFQHYGEKCTCCGEARPEFMTIDHINGGGNKHRKVVGGKGRYIYQWLKKNNYPEGFQTLCWNCNSAKGIYGICPHQKEQKEGKQ